MTSDTIGGVVTNASAVGELQRDRE